MLRALFVISKVSLTKTAIKPKFVIRFSLKNFRAAIDQCTIKSPKFSSIENFVGCSGVLFRAGRRTPDATSGCLTCNVRLRFTHEIIIFLRWKFPFINQRKTWPLFYSLSYAMHTIEKKEIIPVIHIRNYNCQISQIFIFCEHFLTS